MAPFSGTMLVSGSVTIIIIRWIIYIYIYWIYLKVHFESTTFIENWKLKGGGKKGVLVDGNAVTQPHKLLQLVWCLSSCRKVALSWELHTFSMSVRTKSKLVLSMVYDGEHQGMLDGDFRSWLFLPPNIWENTKVCWMATGRGSKER